MHTKINKKFAPTKAAESTKPIILRSSAVLNYVWKKKGIIASSYNRDSHIVCYRSYKKRTAEAVLGKRSFGQAIPF